MNTRLFRLDVPGCTQLWASLEAGMPQLLHWGDALPAGEDEAALAALLQVPLPQGGLDVDERVHWLPQPGTGFADAPGLELRQGGQRLYPQFELLRAEASAQAWRFELVDVQARLRLHLHLRADADSGVFSAEVELCNEGAASVAIEHCASIALPAPLGSESLLTLSGRWAAEFQARRLALPLAGAWVQEARTGRSSHHAYPGMALLEAGCGATQGRVWSAQLAWSGNHCSLVQALRNGGWQWQMGELLLPGECNLGPGQSHRSPVVHLLYSAGGLRGQSLGWQRFVRQRVLPAQAPQRARRVQFNTWEAVYFDHEAQRLKRLASAAAELGVERFVLDDGWFGGRRHDAAGLGDWWPAPELYPQGLAPLAEHCQRLGMQFGLWVEPEGLNADSDLYRAHPDWALQVAGRVQPLGRKQYVLDLGRPQAREHLFVQLSAVLRSAPIDFLKWDMNRDFSHEASADGRPGVRAHVQGLYELMQRLRAAFPELEIESCASGGGRADLGLLAHCRRVWTSDCNDPLERQAMHAAFLHFLPPEVMGAHVGPATNPITGRAASMALRSLMALFGHFGVEADVLALDEADAAQLREAIAFYKQERPWLAGAGVSALDAGEPALSALWACAEDGEQAWLGLVALERPQRAVPGLLRLPGLQAQALYELQAHPLWPVPTPLLKRATALEAGAALRVSGAALASVGLRLPSLKVHSGCLLTLRRVGAGA